MTCFDSLAAGAKLVLVNPLISMSGIAFSPSVFTDNLQNAIPPSQSCSELDLRRIVPIPFYNIYQTVDTITKPDEMK